jgi:LAO/AO transport system kinase
MMDLVTDALAGQRRALARLLSVVEDDGPEAREALARLYPHSGRAHVIGITGAPGSGKSTLAGQLAAELRRRDLTVGIVAVDPTSPFSGGALLGDRIRMRGISADPGVYVRSMASRGSLGGLARSTWDVVQVLDACGYDRILIETVGAGQTEIDIARTAHTTIVILVPGMGDDVQMLKAGILEIADILIVNKADHEGADQVMAALAATLDMAGDSTGAEHPHWRPPILKAVATTGEGVVEVADVAAQHLEFLRSSGAMAERERTRLVERLEGIARERLLRRALARAGPAVYEGLLARLATRDVDPYRAADELLAAAGLAGDDGMTRAERRPMTPPSGGGDG